VGLQLQSEGDFERLVTTKIRMFYYHWIYYYWTRIKLI